MRDLDRTLAFTALLDQSQEFRDGEAGAGGAIITRMLEDYYAWLEEPKQARVPFTAGVHDIYAFARSWIAQGNIRKEA